MILSGGRGGEEERGGGRRQLFGHSPSPRAPLPLCPCLFCSRDVIGLDGWKQYSQEKPGDTDTLCHVRCVHRSDGDVKCLWFCIRFHWHNHLPIGNVVRAAVKPFILPFVCRTVSEPALKNILRRCESL